VLADLQKGIHRAQTPTQCGFRSSGMPDDRHELLLSAEPLSRADIREAMSGNMCRCTAITPSSTPSKR
jgi:aerobic-type carbon monoxide dehydrogenase small subunit (CoxS/CutS family)